MKYHTDEECCTKLKAVKSLLKNIKEQGRSNLIIVHSADSATQLIEELFNELNNKDKDNERKRSSTASHSVYGLWIK